ncbi:retinal short-chain dehydrogenase/reductase [Hymenopellis radicata]|nr:retinal short-chain dehydrogenase/reductase [Hymenopellis radicata]
MSRASDASPIFDSLDVDLVIKVLSHTAFSPFFICMVPIFYFFQGAKSTDAVIVGSGIWLALISTFWLVKWCSLLYLNQGSLFFAPPRFDWGDQVVVITGGSSGIGELLANTLAVRNVNVVVLDVKPIETENYNITYYKCDVSKWDEVEAVAKKISEEIGDPTVLVNNAGVVQGKPILDLTPQDVQQTFGVNTLSHFWTLKAFLPGMIERKAGHVVTMSSIMGYTGCVRMSDYDASKAALMKLHETLRFELDKVYNCPSIRTTLVVPGRVLTPLFKTVQMSSSPLRKFFLPDVAPVTVVKSIITALDDQHSQTIVLPFYGHFMPLLPFLPSFLRDFASWITSADESMTNFKKTSGLREDEMKN